MPPPWRRRREWSSEAESDFHDLASEIADSVGRLPPTPPGPTRPPCRGALRGAFTPPKEDRNGVSMMERRVVGCLWGRARRAAGGGRGCGAAPARSRASFWVGMRASGAGRSGSRGVPGVSSRRGRSRVSRRMGAPAAPRTPEERVRRSRVLVGAGAPPRERETGGSVARRTVPGRVGTSGVSWVLGRRATTRHAGGWAATGRDGSESRGGVRSTGGGGSVFFFFPRGAALRRRRARA